ncbi:MAG: glycosyltransferase family 4 protein [Pseudomonadota bacterium]
MSLFPASFAVPGALDTPTGGYAYARRLLGAAPGAGLDLAHLALPGGFPAPDAGALRTTCDVLEHAPADRPLLIDGLAYGALPLDLVRRIRAPIVVLCHHPLALETGLDAHTARALADTERAALAEARHVLTTSHATAEILRHDYGVAPGKLTVAPPGTDPAPRAPRRERKCQLLSVGSISPRKGHPALIEALAPRAHLDWSLRIVGPARDPDALAKLKSAISGNELGSRITLAGALPAAELAAAYQSADLFVLASNYEGFGMVFTEAMSHGLPTVGLTCPAVEEATGGGACLVPLEDLSATLGLLISDQGTRDALAERCWTAAQTFLRWPQTATIVAGVLKEVKA